MAQTHSIQEAALKSVVAAVEATLADFFHSRAPLTAELGDEFAHACAALETYVLRGGKRVRPQFAWLGWLGAGGDDEGPEADAVRQVCASLELVQACALIHDDIIDASSHRRGYPTVHIDFAEQHRDQKLAGSSDQFGTSTAILLGDLAICWADDMVREAALTPQASRRLTPVWAAMRTEVLGGQYLDICNEARARQSVSAALHVNRFKTAAYTIERPLHIGAVLADGSADIVAAYRRYGRDIGIAFQLRDDLLGVFGDPAVTGKPSGDDLRTGKRTALLAIAAERAEASAPASAALLRQRIGTSLTQDDVEELRTIIRDCGAVDEVEARISQLRTSGIAALSEGAIAPEVCAKLESMARAVTARVS